MATIRDPSTQQEIVMTHRFSKRGLITNLPGFRPNFYYKIKTTTPNLVLHSDVFTHNGTLVYVKIDGICVLARLSLCSRNPFCLPMRCIVPVENPFIEEIPYVSGEISTVTRTIDKIVRFGPDLNHADVIFHDNILPNWKSTGLEARFTWAIQIDVELKNIPKKLILKYLDNDHKNIIFGLRTVLNKHDDCFANDEELTEDMKKRIVNPHELLKWIV